LKAANDFPGKEEVRRRLALLEGVEGKAAELSSDDLEAGNFTWAYSLLQESACQLPNDAEILHDFAWTVGIVVP
jgi:hypothetical protein